MVAISSWGRISYFDHNVCDLSDSTQLPTMLSNRNVSIAFGNGRSYGDACLNHGQDYALWRTRKLDKFIQFDRARGVLTCEAGVLLEDIHNLTIPDGWILPVTPGTQLITVGGAIANDIHGKNHHTLGSFGNHIKLLKLWRTNGTQIECGPEHNRDWFSATVGGIGLTGVISQATIQLKKIASPWLEAESIPYSSLEEFFNLADDSEQDWEHTVSWVDCLSGMSPRGIFMRANFSSTNTNNTPKERIKKMPFCPPISLVNGLTLRPFNSLYFNVNKLKAGKSHIHYKQFFYPLDNLLGWNQMYGPKGFYQYQCVIPREYGHQAISSIFQEIKRSGEGSFLAVLKTFGNRPSMGMLSFPMPGVTLALDFPNKGRSTLDLLNKLDVIVREAKGRIYLAKDARMSKEFFEEGYPRLTDFLKYRDPGIGSEMSRRLMGH